MIGKGLKGLAKALTTDDGLFAPIVYNSNECLNHINIMHMQNVISKRVKPSYEDTYIGGFFHS